MKAHSVNVEVTESFHQIAQCSKMVPGMSGSEIRASLEAVNWDTNIAVKNLKIDKLYRSAALFSQQILTSPDFQDWSGNKTKVWEGAAGGGLGSRTGCQ